MMHFDDVESRLAYFLFIVYILIHAFFINSVFLPISSCFW